MAALRRERLPPARRPFCFVAYGLFWAVGGPFWPRWAAGLLRLASGTKTLEMRAILPYCWTTEHRLQLRGHILSSQCSSIASDGQDAVTTRARSTNRQQCSKLPVPARAEHFFGR